MESVKKKKEAVLWLYGMGKLKAKVTILDLAGFYWNIFYNVSLLSFI